MVKVRYIAFFIISLFSGFNYCISQNASPYKIEKVPVSSVGFNELAPSIYGNGIVFISDKRVSSFKNVTTYKNEKIFNIFVAVKTDTSKWGRVHELKDPLNRLVAYGAACISSDGKKIYFSRTVLSGKQATRKNARNPYGIFSGDLNGSEITNVKPFEYNDPAFTYDVLQPSISQDGKYLFFASNMPGGQGGSDLYYCENVSGKWGKPVNLGSKVNSPSLENYPYIHPSGRLYFSSDRPSSAPYMGNMDIYYTSLIYGAWDSPVALPEPINSKDDDYAFVAEENLRNGYFTRNSKPTTDIFTFTSTMIRKAVCDTLITDSFCYQFEEANATKIVTPSFKYTWHFGDGSTATGPKVQHCFPSPGLYIVTVDITDSLKKETRKAVKTYEMPIRRTEQPYITAYDNVSAGQQLSLNADSTNLPGWKISQFYWNFGDESFAIGKEVTHKFLKEGVYSVQLIVSDTPDANGVIREKCVSKNIKVKRIP